MATTYLTPGVYVEEVPSGIRHADRRRNRRRRVRRLHGQGAERRPERPATGMKPRLVTNWTQFEQLYGGFIPGAMLPHSVYGYFNNGGSARLHRAHPAHRAGEGARHAGPARRPTARSARPSSSRPSSRTPTSPSPSRRSRRPTTPTTTPADVPRRRHRERQTSRSSRFPGLTLTKGDRNVETVVNKESTKVKVATKIDTSQARRRPRQPARRHATPSSRRRPTPVAVPGPGVRRLARPPAQGINGLVIAEDVTMVMVPDLVTAATKDDGTVDLDLWKSVQLALINHCEGQANRMAVLDAPPGMTPAADQGVAQRRGDVRLAVRHAVLPVDQGREPGGHQRRHRDHGAAERPHGRHLGPHRRHPRRVEGARPTRSSAVRSTSRSNITKAEQGLLNPIGINCIRPFGTRGIRVWGARTLSSNTDWTYINVRRLFNMIETTIMNGTQYAVFEPNDMTLWEGLKRTINAFLRGLWRDGALFGATAEQAFYVKCDERDEPARVDRPGQGRRRGRHRPGEAGRVRHLPHRPDQGDVGLRPA